MKKIKMTKATKSVHRGFKELFESDYWKNESEYLRKQRGKNNDK
jgi:hypothetical protein